MKVWDLEREYDHLISFVLEGRERKKQDIGASVAKIKKEIMEKGEGALVEFGRRWDGWTGDYDLKFTNDEIRRQAALVPRKDIPVLKGMIRNVTAYHRAQKGMARTFRRTGLAVEESFVPVERALVYVPGGKAAYPSSLIMGVVPARIAGVKEIYVTTPAFDGVVNPYVASAAELLEIKDIYRIGGAQSIYAFAYGIGSIPKVDMIVGPGNAYVDEAKRDVYGVAGIDMLAGPSELVVLCTEAFSADVVAWDLFSQGEHDEMAVVGLFSPSMEHIEEVKASMDRLIAVNERRDIIDKALKGSGFLVFYRDVERAVEAINRIAPEHMELIGDEALAERILYPGIVYVGPLTAVAMGDYYIGTNHVLPTGGAGRFTAGLSVDRFTKRKVVVKIEDEFLRRYGDNAARLARIEGLFAHGEAIKARKGL